MSIVKINGININVGGYDGYLKTEKIDVLRYNREKSILSKAQLIQKIKEGKAKRLNTQEGFKRVYVYNAKMDLDNKNSHDAYALHFYNENGELIMTYPWNGRVNQNALFFEGYISHGETITDLNLSSTKQGSIILQPTTSYYRAPLAEPTKPSLSAPEFFMASNGYMRRGYDRSIMWEDVGMKPFDFATEKAVEIFANGGDEMIENIASHSYVI